MPNFQRLIIIFLLLMTGLSAISQNNSQGNTKGKITGSVRATIVDTSGKQDLSDAMVSVTALVSDSSDIQFVTTDKKGYFQVKGLQSASYRLLISFEGYQHIRKYFTVSNENRDISFDILYMQRATDQMQEITIERRPVTIRKDTVEYNAGSFATKPNAVAEDLLKKMSGIQVDKNGGNGGGSRRLLCNA